MPIGFHKNESAISPFTRQRTERVEPQERIPHPIVARDGERVTPGQLIRGRGSEGSGFGFGF